MTTNHPWRSQFSKSPRRASMGNRMAPAPPLRYHSRIMVKRALLGTTRISHHSWWTRSTFFKSGTNRNRTMGRNITRAWSEVSSAAPAWCLRSCSSNRGIRALVQACSLLHQNSSLITSRRQGSIQSKTTFRTLWLWSFRLLMEKATGICRIKRSSRPRFSTA